MVKTPANQRRLPCGSGPDNNGTQHGVALVLTLLVVAMLTVVVVAFNSVTRTEQAAARNFSRLHGSEATAEFGLQQGTRLLYENVFRRMNSSPAITQPGRAIVGEDAQSVSLSSAHFEPDANFGTANLNYVYVTNSTNNQFASIVYVTNPATYTNYFRAPWVQVTNSDGELTGRYAFWIDDEGSRMNLNLADMGIRSSIYPTNVRPLDASRLNLSTKAAQIFTNDRLGFRASLTHADAPRLSTLGQTPTWGYYFVPEQIRSFDPNNGYTARAGVNDLWNAVQFQVAGGMANMTNRDIAPPSLGKYAVDRAPENAGTDAAVFLAQNIDNATLRSRFAGRTFASKYGPNPARQIAAAILDYPRDPASGQASGLDSVNEDGVPTAHLGINAPPYLNEIIVRPYYAVDGVPTAGDQNAGEAGGGQIEAQVYVQVEVVNPFTTPSPDEVGVRFRRQRFDFTGTYTRGGQQYEFSGGRASWTPAEDEEFREPIVVQGATGAKSFRTNLYFRYEWQSNLQGTGPVSDVTMQVNFQFGSVQLLGDPENPATIRDWAVGADLPVWSIALDPASDRRDWVGGGNSGPLENLPEGVTMTDAAARAVAKNDPRVRTFVDWGGQPNVQAWSERIGGQITMGSPNSSVNFAATSIAGLPPDRATNDSFFNHPSFAYPAPTGPGLYKSIFDLGRIHTGLQWRTLHMHAQPAAESAQFIPDWALLEVLAVTNAWIPATVRLNPSGLPFPALTNFASFAQLATNSGGRLSRAGAYASFLSGFANLTNPTALANASVSIGSVSNTNSADLPSGVNFTSNDLAVLSTNLLTMTFNNRWDSFRRANPTNYPRGIYSSLGEVVEISGLGALQGGPDLSKAQLEGRARVLYESLSPVSDTFTIYSVGEALEVINVGGSSITNVLGETRLKSQVSWVPERDNNGNVRRDDGGRVIYRLKQGWTLPVITPN
jgi:hypothetical protein